MHVDVAMAYNTHTSKHETALATRYQTMIRENNRQAETIKKATKTGTSNIAMSLTLSYREATLCQVWHLVYS